MQLRVWALTGGVLALAALPLFASAQTAGPSPSPAPSPTFLPRTTVSMGYRMPPGWSRGADPRLQSFTIRDGDKVHVLAVTALSDIDTANLDALAAERMAAARKVGDDVTDEGTTTSCDGEPAHRWSERGASFGVAMVEHVVLTTVTGGFALVTYTHRQDVGDRKDALDAMTMVCPGPFANPVPTGWTGPPAPRTRFPVPIPRQTETLTSPDETSTFVATYRPFAESYYPPFERESVPQGTITSDQQQPCGAGHVRMIDARIDQQIVEVAIAYLHGTAYRYVYTRPATHAPDAGAERALTAFCHADGWNGPTNTPV